MFKLFFLQLFVNHRELTDTHSVLSGRGLIDFLPNCGEKTVLVLRPTLDWILLLAQINSSYQSFSTSNFLQYLATILQINFSGFFSPLAWLTKHPHQNLKSDCPDFFLGSMLPYYWSFYSKSEEVLQDE